MSSHPLVQMEHITHVYGSGSSRVNALTDVSFSVRPGEFIAVTGPSGSGKSTLLHIAGCLQRPTSGSYLLDGAEVSKLGSDRLAAIRNRDFGFVFQMFCLLPRLTALQNVALPLTYAGVRRKERRERAGALLARVGLGDRMSHLPGAMSGGEQQRVAIARALVNEPRIVFADEPTGNLDSATSDVIMGIFQECVAQGTAVVVVSHEEEVVRRCSRIETLRDSRVV